MPGRRKGLPASWALAGLVILLGIGIAAIFRARMATGELYPPYSSLRFDPSGTALLFQALTNTGRFQSVTREFQPLHDSGIHNATVFFLGCNLWRLNLDSDAGLKEWEQAAQPGNRLVIALASDSLAFPIRQTAVPPSGTPETPLKQRWHIQIARSPAGQESWPSYFSLAEGWSVLSAIDHRPVIIERAFGSGTLVLSLGSSMFTNRSLADGPADTKADVMLARITGSEPRVVFDEEHLGIADSGTVLGLARRYQLTGLLWGLLVLAVAFIWNQAAGFPPPPDISASATSDLVSGRNSRSGLVQLLRGQIMPSRLIETCVSEWNRVHPKARLENIPDSDPVQSYRSIQNQLTSK